MKVYEGDLVPTDDGFRAYSSQVGLKVGTSLPQTFDVVMQVGRPVAFHFVEIVPTGVRYQEQCGKRVLLITRE
jgi:hypothetical protein